MTVCPVSAGPPSSPFTQVTLADLRWATAATPVTRVGTVASRVPTATSSAACTTNASMRYVHSQGSAGAGADGCIAGMDCYEVTSFCCGTRPSCAISEPESK